MTGDRGREWGEMKDDLTKMLAKVFTVVYEDAVDMFALPRNADTVKGMLAYTAISNADAAEEKSKELYAKVLPMVLEDLEIPLPWTNDKENEV